MKTIVIPTTQNVELEYPVADIGDRIAAFFIDFLIQIGYLILVYMFLEEFHARPSTGWSIIIFLPVALYTIVSEIALNGQTIGKRVRNLRVIRFDGSAPSLGDFFLRWLLRLVDIYTMYGVVAVFTISINKKGQRLGDLAAGTTVIKQKLVADFDDTIFRNLDEGYEMKFPQIAMLSDKDMSILKEVLDAGLKSNNPEILKRLSDKVKSVTGIKAEMKEEVFLEYVLRDYNYLYGK
ncbi:MAG: RDD family protein [Bacteroidia bacterium]|nr:RDD family protein [Bacteroidia bacterium]